MMRTGKRFEEVLALVYVDATFRKRFLADPKTVALESGLSEDEAQALAAIDREGLDLACRSFASKRDAIV